MEIDNVVNPLTIFF